MAGGACSLGWVPVCLHAKHHVQRMLHSTLKSSMMAAFAEGSDDELSWYVSAETSRAFADAACGLVTTGSREVPDSDVGSAKLFQTRSRIAQVLRTRLEAAQAAKFFVVARHPLTHVQKVGVLHF